MVDKDSKQALQVAKEITVKFIETGRVSPSNFSEIFPAIYNEVLRTISGAAPGAAPGPSDADNA